MRALLIMIAVSSVAHLVGLHRVIGFEGASAVCLFSALALDVIYCTLRTYYLIPSIQAKDINHE